MKKSGQGIGSRGGGLNELGYGSGGGSSEGIGTPGVQWGEEVGGAAGAGGVGGGGEKYNIGNGKVSDDEGEKV